ncbi:2425_t:CDS:1, partial [Gigaspora rosea]
IYKAHTSLEVVFVVIIVVAAFVVGLCDSCICGNVWGEYCGCSGALGKGCSS